MYVDVDLLEASSMQCRLCSSNSSPHTNTVLVTAKALLQKAGLSLILGLIIIVMKIISHGNINQIDDYHRPAKSRVDMVGFG